VTTNRFFIIDCLTIFTLLPACRLGKGAIGADQDYAELRQKMVREQIAAEGVRDAEVLRAMGKIPRHEFIPQANRSLAYQDGPLPIGHGQTISQPYIVAFMTEALELKQGMKVLEIGTGSAYQTAVLAELGAEVFTIEIINELCASAAALLKKLGYRKVHTRCGDGYRGWVEAAPFERILLTAAPEQIPQALLAQLKDGGVLIAPVGGMRQHLVRVRRLGNLYKEESLLPVRFVPMVGE
jgi:protein-L-isoaspartate(D-aspartate) O-methyltransferase